MKQDKWEKVIMSLSEMVYDTSINKIMAFPWECKNDGYKKHKCLDGYICHCDDGYLCEHRAEWLIDFIHSLLTSQKERIIKRLGEVEGFVMDSSINGISRGKRGKGMMPISQAQSIIKEVK